MLHQIKEAGCVAGLHQLVGIQRELLSLACDPAYVPPPGRDAILARFGQAGEWMWEQLWRYGHPRNGESSLQQAVNAVAAHLDARPGLGRDVLAAFDNDREFGRFSDDATFKFSFRALDEPTRHVVGRLAKAFYALLSSGVPSDVHGGIAPLSVRSFKDAFWASNEALRACPACDRSRPDEVREVDASDADHFFPQSKYPFLAVHPRNLVPVCMECNQRAKLDIDPIRDHQQAPMLGTFHPYASQARDHVDVQVLRTAATNQAAVRVTEAGAMTPRVTSMIEVWNLEGRWASRLPDIIYAVREIVAQMADEHREKVDELAFREGLERARARRARQLGSRPNLILEHAYLSYVVGEPSELRTYYSLYLNKRECHDADPSGAGP